MALFDDLDVDHDGCLTLAEVTQCWDHVPAAVKKMMKSMSVAGVFEHIYQDGTGTGSVKKDDFIEGVLNIAVSKNSVESMRQIHLFGVFSVEKEMPLPLPSLCSYPVLTTVYGAIIWQDIWYLWTVDMLDLLDILDQLDILDILDLLDLLYKQETDLL